MKLFLLLFFLILINTIFYKKNLELFSNSSRINNLLKIKFQSENGDNYYTAFQRNVNISHPLINSA